MKIAIQGELGSFSHQATLELFPRAQVVPCAASKEVFDRVVSGNAQAAVVPIENSLAGSVAEHYDLLLSSKLWIEREWLLRIEHNLIAAPGVRRKDLRRVLSHPVALAQCLEFFRKHPQIRPEPFYDTAGSVKHVMAEGLKDTAAIASAKAAEVYGAGILQRGLEDNKRNLTRFFVLRKRRTVAKDANKTSVAFVLKNEPGVLFKALSVFALRDISLSRIESRPMRGRPWEYVFYVDLLRGDDEPARKALDHLREVSEFVQVLGIYRAAKE